MDLLQNPFHILTATTRDNRQRIVELADERSLIMDPSECMQARSTLTNPRKRLAAEIAWLPGVGPKRTNEILTQLETTSFDFFCVDKLLPIAKSNLIATGLSRLTDSTSDKIAQWIIELVETFEDVDPEELCAILNEERIVSGFPQIADTSIIQMEIKERRSYYKEIMKSALDNLSTKELVETVTLAVETMADQGEIFDREFILIHDLVDSYEVEAQAFFEKEEENIKTLVERIRTAADEQHPEVLMTQMVNQLIQVVKNFDFVAQPIQVSTKSRGLDHDASCRIANIVRELAVYLFNEHDKLNYSQQLTNMLQEVFSEVLRVAERTTEDVKFLDEVAEKRVGMIKENESRAEEWRREITFEAEVGTVFKDKLRISPDGIEWKNTVLTLASINRIRWGGTRHSLNGIPTGTTYSIICGSNSDYISIELRNKDVYNKFVDCLWKAVGVRLLLEYLEGLRDGKKYIFGSVIISDFGIELDRRKLFSNNEHVFCPWSELVIWDGPGVFCIGKKGDKNLSVALSYQDQDNIHVWEAAIRMFWKSGGLRLSSLLKGE